MKPSILISSPGAIAEPMTKQFTVAPGAENTIFVRGLAGEEVVDIELLAADMDPEEADGTDALWVKVMTLNVADHVVTVNTPGAFRVRIAASAGAVVIGAY